MHTLILLHKVVLEMSCLCKKNQAYDDRQKALEI